MLHARPAGRAVTRCVPAGADELKRERRDRSKARAVVQRRLVSHLHRRVLDLERERRLFDEPAAAVRALLLSAPETTDDDAMESDDADLQHSPTSEGHAAFDDFDGFGAAEDDAIESDDDDPLKLRELDVVAVVRRALEGAPKRDSVPVRDDECASGDDDEGRLMDGVESFDELGEDDEMPARSDDDARPAAASASLLADINLSQYEVSSA